MTSFRNPSKISPIDVRRYGDKGPSVVLLHGGPGAPGEMAPVADILKDRFHIIEPLQRKGGGELPLTVERHVLDLHDVLEAALKDGPLRMVGFSWGAMLGFSYAARFSESVCLLVLIGCGTFDESSRSIYQKNIQNRMSPPLASRINHINNELSNEKNQTRRDELFAEFGAIYTRLQSLDALSDVSQDVLYYDEAGFRETWEDVLQLQERGIQPAEFARITSPVIMIHGEEDPHPGPLIFRSLKPFVRDLTYMAIPHCGHKPWTEQPARDHFFDLLLDILH